MANIFLLFGEGTVSNVYTVRFLFWWASSSSESIFDIGFKVISGAVGVIGLIFAVYVVFLKRKWKEEEKHVKEKEENRKLAFENKFTMLRSELQQQIVTLSQSVNTLIERTTKLENSLGDLAKNQDLGSFKYSVEDDISNLQQEIKNFQSTCTLRHEKMAASGSLSDLKDRMDEIVRKTDKLEDFRHGSADRYVLMISYQQDTRMLTDAISVLRQDLRTVVEMVDNL